ncbi:MAG: zinc ABC transporter substrate-binding protein [Bacteroidales bacterium]
MVRYAIFLFISVLLFSSCGKDKSTSSEEKTVISVSILPQKYFIEQIGGDEFDVNVMVPPGANPVTYEPSPRQMQKLNKSKAYLEIGHLVFEKAWMPKIRSLNSRMEVFDQSEGVDLITDEVNSHGGHNHSHGTDPHIWMSPKSVRKQAKTIYNMLRKLNSDNDEKYQENYTEFLHQLDMLDAYMKKQFATVDNRTFLIFHPALSYLARDYELKQIPIEIEGKEPSSLKMEELIQKAEENNIKTIFIQEQFSTDNAQVIAKELDAEVVPINPLGYNWFSEMEEITDKLVKSMNPSFINCRQKERNRTRIRQKTDTVTRIQRILRLPDTVSADFFIKIDNYLKNSFLNS